MYYGFIFKLRRGSSDFISLNCKVESADAQLLAYHEKDAMLGTII